MEEIKNHNQRSTTNKRIAEHIFNGSITLAGVCVTIIALFRVMKVGLGTYADEILAANTCVFIASSILAYISLKREKNNTVEKIADLLFFVGLSVMMVVGILIVYSTY